MIVGNGDIASAIIDRPDVTFFASGVSNSKCYDIEQYKREHALLGEQTRSMHFVYFSSLCVYYNYGTLYARHKKSMEIRVSQIFPSYTIVRLGNISWGKNPNTLINYFKAHPEADIQKVYRHIVEKDEFQYWLGMMFVGGQDTMNIPGRMVWVPDLVKEIREGKY